MGLIFSSILSPYVILLEHLVIYILIIDRYIFIAILLLVSWFVFFLSFYHPFLLSLLGTSNRSPAPESNGLMKKRSCSTLQCIVPFTRIWDTSEVFPV